MVRLGRNAAAAAARRWRDRRFRPAIRHDPAAPELFLSPHLDDAVFNCWGLLTSEQPVQVVNVFAGVPDPGFVTRWDAICGARDSHGMARARLEEDRLALALAGRSPLNLDLLEVESRRGSPRRSLSSVESAIAAVMPAAARVHAPAGIGGHVDHVTLRTLARALAHAGVPVRLYAELPYCVLHGWPHWVSGRPPEAHRDVDAFWADFLAAVPEVGDLRAAHVVELDDNVAAAKLQAMRAYRTQFPALNGGEVDVLAAPDVHRFEVAWEVRPRGSLP
jgi:LmbE family N-acetylglucosaminyl deacetylase